MTNPQAPTVTPANIEAVIQSEHYFTAADGVAGVRGFHAPKGSESQSLDLLTICVLVLTNGFTVLGQSACASPERFNAELGRKIAREDAIRSVWPLLGYELKTKLAAEATAHHPV